MTLNCPLLTLFFSLKCLYFVSKYWPRTLVEAAPETEAAHEAVMEEPGGHQPRLPPGGIVCSELNLSINWMKEMIQLTITCCPILNLHKTWLCMFYVCFLHQLIDNYEDRKKWFEQKITRSGKILTY